MINIYKWILSFSCHGVFINKHTSKRKVLTLEIQLVYYHLIVVLWYSGAEKNQSKVSCFPCWIAGCSDQVMVKVQVTPRALWCPNLSQKGVWMSSCATPRWPWEQQEERTIVCTGHFIWGWWLTKARELDNSSHAYSGSKPWSNAPWSNRSNLRVT